MDFAYIDLVLQDTPIFDEEEYSKIRQSFPTDKGNKRNLTSRKETVLLFMDYLKRQEHKEKTEGDNELSGIINYIFDNGLKNQIRRVNNSVKSNTIL
jgi:hypothetical protein